jgi:hypothetical protein
VIETLRESRKVAEESLDTRQLCLINPCADRG